MTDTHTGEGWTLHAGDAFARPWPDVDHVLSDPPYAAHVFENARTKSSLSASHEGSRGQISTRLAFQYEAMEDSLGERFAAHCAEHVGRWVVFTLDAESIAPWRDLLTAAGLRHVRQGLYRRINAMPQLTGDRPASPGDFVEIAHAGTGRMRWNGGGKHAYWEGFRDRGAVRKGQKPESLLRTWVEQFTDPGDLICDPFTGSGTTGVAAVQLGRRFLGFELDPKMAAYAAGRIRAAERQGALFRPKAKPPKRSDQAEFPGFDALSQQDQDGGDPQDPEQDQGKQRPEQGRLGDR